MELRQLAALVAVADQGSFSAAARSLHTVQSNISAHIARLERQLSATLVDRSSGQLTAEGVIVVDRARRIERELAAIEADVASLDAAVEGEVRLGAIGTTARWLVPPLMAAMADAHPRVAVVIVDATTSSLLPRLTAAALDLAVVNQPIDDPEIETEPLFHEDTILLVPAGHPLHGSGQVALGDLDGVPLLLEPQGTTFRRVLDEQAADAGIELTAQSEVDGMRLLASLAFQGFGAALVPASAAPRSIVGSWERVEVGGLLGRSVGLARRRRGLPSAPSRALREVLVAVVEREIATQPGIHGAGPS